MLLLHHSILRWLTAAVAVALVGAAGASAAVADDASLAVPYLLSGKLGAGEADLIAHLKQKPDDAQARFGLGIVQTLQAFEQGLQGLYRAGLRTETTRRAMPLNQFLPQNRAPQKVAYADLRRLVQECVDRLNRAEATLALVKDPDVKLPLPVTKISIDVTGTGHMLSALSVLGPGGATPPAKAEEAPELVIAFDRGDAAWLRGYCHFLAAWGEVFLALDAHEAFEAAGHRFFVNVETPHTFLLEESRERQESGFSRELVSDAVAFIHLWRYPVVEPQRMEAAIKHLETMAACAKEMWTCYLAETDDDREWIPNPKQTGVVGVPVSRDMIDTWLGVIGEAQEVLAGKRLIPFWRGHDAQRGVNLRRALLESRVIDPVLWVQGTAATPYLEKGPLTRFVDPAMLVRINRVFGGNQFWGFAFWFN